MIVPSCFKLRAGNVTYSDSMRKRAVLPLSNMSILAGAIILSATSSVIADTEYVLEETVVTAQKRAQALNDIGVTATALSSEDMTNLGINTASDLNSLAPNLNVRDSNSGITTNITLRGVGLQDFSVNNTPTVGTYIDDVFLSSTGLLNGQLYDLERIEILKGPQGTLYGRNTTGGLVNFITAKPSEEFEAKVSATVGNYETRDVNFVLNGALTDTLNARLALQSHIRDEGFFESRVLNRDLGREDVLSGRLQFAWTPSDETAINFKVESSDVDSEPGQFVHFGTLNNPLGSGPCPAILAGKRDSSCIDPRGYSDTDNDPFTGDWDNLGEGVKSNMVSSVLKVETELGIGTLTSITGYTHFNRIYTAEAGAGPGTFLVSTPDDAIEQYSEELRLTGSKDGLVDWIIGAFYSYDDIESKSLAEVSALFMVNTRGAISQQTTSSALFAHTDWYLSDATRLIAGLRYTWEEKEFKAGNIAVSPADNSTVVFPLTNVEDEIDEDRQSWKLGMEHDLTEDVLIYASVSEGFKSGGFFGGTFTTNSGQYAPFDPEVLTAYEVGYKARLAEGTVQFNGAAFYYDYQDIQVFTQADIGGVIFSKLSNVSEAEVTGIELELAWRPLQGLDVRGGLGWLDTELGSFTIARGGVPVTLPKGNQLASAPTISYNAQISYEFAVSENMEIYTLIGGSYTDDVFKEPSNQKFLQADEFFTANARIALRDSNDSWEVALWGNNLTNEEYESHIFDNGVGQGGITYGAPRTYGLSFTYNYR